VAITAYNKHKYTNGNPMKNFCFLTRSSGFVALTAVVALLNLSNPALAQEKGGERLMKLQRINTAADVQKLEPGDILVMTCPKCKETWAKAVQPPGKGGRQETAIVGQHQCPSCGAKIETQGVGKQATTVFKHMCKQCGSEDAYCCVIKKGAGPTKGMEESKDHVH
jgi:hypothetical protein